MIDMIQCFNQLKKDDNVPKPNFSLGSPMPHVTLDDDFEDTIS